MYIFRLSFIKVYKEFSINKEITIFSVLFIPHFMHFPIIHPSNSIIVNIDMKKLYRKKIIVLILLIL